jgi:leucine dehydrogenase
MSVFEALGRLGHEQVVFSSDPGSSYRGIIAVHSTVLGPAIGGTRLYPYASDDEALQDVLRLSRGMTYKNAAAGLPFGGGKAVIIGEGSRKDRSEVFRAHGRFIERLGGLFVTGEDVGTSPEDMELIRRETRYVNRGGDPSPSTARGVFRAIQAAVRERFGKDDLDGRTVAIQGLGHVGRALALLLDKAGAKLVVTDVDPGRVKGVIGETRAEGVEPSAIYDVAGAVFAPCAMGGILDDTTVPRLKVAIVAGAANNQLREERHGDALEKRGLLYAPDFVANAGGIIRSTVEFLGWKESEVTARIDGIYDTILAVFDTARRERIPTYAAANRLAEDRLRRGRARDPVPSSAGAGGA